MHPDSGQTTCKTLNVGLVTSYGRCFILSYYMYTLKVGTQARLLATQSRKLPWRAPLLKQSLPPSLPQELQLEPTLNGFEKLLCAFQNTQATSTAVLCRSAAAPTLLYVCRKHRQSWFYLRALDPRKILGLCVPQLRQVVGGQITQEVSKRVFGRRSCVVSIRRGRSLLLSSLGSLVAFSFVLGVTAAHCEIGSE